MSSSIQNLINSANNNVRSGPNPQAPQQGSEQRTSVLPSMLPSNLGFFGSPYSPADAMMTPPQLGIKVGDSIGDVVSAVKGVGFYTDQIGFGAPSTGLTNGMPLKPLGVNYFLNTNVKCSNGANMYEYIQGIPEGNALGDKVKKAMEDMGLPPLKGLAPGMIEDAENALNPVPLINSLFGSGYPECEQLTLPVGDAYGRISDPDTGEPWISEKDSAFYDGGVYKQTKWIQRKQNGMPVNMTRDEWVATPKTYNPDGSPISEGFTPFLEKPGTIIAVGILCIIAFAVIRKKK
jgi:hypothetical protein